MPEFEAGDRVIWTAPNGGRTQLPATVMGTDGRRVLIVFDDDENKKVRRARGKDVKHADR